MILQDPFCTALESTSGADNPRSSPIGQISEKHDQWRSSMASNMHSYWPTTPGAPPLGRFLKNTTNGVHVRSYWQTTRGAPPLGRFLKHTTNGVQEWPATCVLIGRQHAELPNWSDFSKARPMAFKHGQKHAILLADNPRSSSIGQISETHDQWRPSMASNMRSYWQTTRWAFWLSNVTIRNTNNIYRYLLPMCLTSSITQIGNYLR